MMGHVRILATVRTATYVPSASVPHILLKIAAFGQREDPTLDQLVQGLQCHDPQQRE